jgi:hypothetical protein
MSTYVILMNWTDQGLGPTGTPFAAAITPMHWPRSMERRSCKPTGRWGTTTSYP